MKAKQKYSDKIKMLAGGNQASIKFNNTETYNNSISSQCRRLLEWLEKGEQLTTFECRKRGVMHPAGRVKDLRNQGCQILTHRAWQKDSNGVRHLFAKYILISANHGGAA